MLVRDLMTVAVVTASPDASLKETARLFVAREVSGAPVVTDRGELVGMVTKSDLLREHEQGSRLVREVMSSEVISLTETMTVTQAARILVHHRIRRAPVLRGGAIVGIVAQLDLLRPYIRTDDEILADIEQEVLVGALALSPRLLRARVHDGVVVLEGPVQSAQQHALLRRLVVAVPGVVELIDGAVIAPAEVRPDAARTGAGNGAAR